MSRSSQGDLNAIEKFDASFRERADRQGSRSVNPPMTANERALLSPSSVAADGPIQEKCGIVGVVTPHDGAPRIARNALVALQHRGQDSAGISVHGRRELKTYYGMGLIPVALPEELVDLVGPGRVAIAHNRYSTSGSVSKANAQPVQIREGDFVLSLAHNGNLTNPDWFRRFVVADDDASDTILLARYLMLRRLEYGSWKETFVGELPNAEGAFSAVAITEDGSVHGFRDPWGIRPFVLGAFADGGVIFASETVAFDAVQATFVRQIQRGEIMSVTSDGVIRSAFFGSPKRGRFCTFENFYFSRPESFSNQMRVQAGRIASGRRLAERMVEKGIEADVVVPIRDSGYYAAQGFGEQSGLALRNAVGTSHYVGRSFIMAGQGQRAGAVSGKHTIIPDQLEDQSLAVVDDSVVRGTTMARIGQGLLNAGARQVHIFSASPPIIERCDLGVDMKAATELPAAAVGDRPLADIERHMAGLIGSDSITFLSTEEIATAFGRSNRDQCTFCLGGEHPVYGRQEVFDMRRRASDGRLKLCVFISGTGSNLREIIRAVEAGEIDAEITSVVSNLSDAAGLHHAELHAIPAVVVESKGRLKEPNQRSAFERELIEHVKATMPDVLVLAGWKIVLGDPFLDAMQELEIPVINLHPALLSRTDETHVATSRGRIPVLRGAHSIHDAFELNLRVSGVTVHQVLPRAVFDTGPILIKEEVTRRPGESWPSWEARIHSAEHRVLPTAIKRVIHVMTHGIDVSTGRFPW